VCVCVYVCVTGAHMCASVNRTWTCVYTEHARTHTCTHAHMHTCTHAHMHTCTHAHIHTYTHTHMHTYHPKVATHEPRTKTSSSHLTPTHPPLPPPWPAASTLHMQVPVTSIGATASELSDKSRFELFQRVNTPTTVLMPTMSRSQEHAHTSARIRACRYIRAHVRIYIHT